MLTIITIINADCTIRSLLFMIIAFLAITYHAWPWLSFKAGGPGNGYVRGDQDWGSMTRKWIYKGRSRLGVQEMDIHV